MSAENSLPILKRGQAGQERFIKQLQEILYGQGFYQGRPDGVFGNLTYAALIAFQQTHNGRTGEPLDVDGQVGPATWWALLNPSGAPQRIAKHEPPNYSGQTDSAERNAVLTVCHSQLGAKEIPDGSNTGGMVTKYHEFCGMPPIYWCLACQVWVTHTALGKLPWKDGKKHVHVAGFWNSRAPEERFKVGDPKHSPRPGDFFVIVHKDGTGHIGIVAAIHEDGRLLVYEGNSANRYRLVERRPGRNDHVGYINFYGDRDKPVKFRLGFPDGSGEVTGLQVDR